MCTLDLMLVVGRWWVRQSWCLGGKHIFPCISVGHLVADGSPWIYTSYTAGVSWRSEKERDGFKNRKLVLVATTLCFSNTLRYSPSCLAAKLLRAEAPGLLETWVRAVHTYLGINPIEHSRACFWVCLCKVLCCYCVHCQWQISHSLMTEFANDWIILALPIDILSVPLIFFRVSPFSHSVLSRISCQCRGTA